MFFKKRSAKPETTSPAVAGQLGQLDLLKQRIHKTDLPEYVATQAESELAKLKR